MKSKRNVLLVLTAVAVVSLYVYDRYDTQTFNSTDPAAAQLEMLPSSNQTPEGSLSSCIDAQVGASCSFSINQKNHTGTCQDILGTLTCGPSFLEE